MRVEDFKVALYTPERNAKISAAHADGRIPPVEPKSGPDHPSWRGDAIGYTQAHFRVVKARGAATEYDCVGCGGFADEWAIDHNRATARGFHGGRDKALSADVDAYVPPCRSCHRTADRRGGFRVA
jgi:hypothetical protein